MTIFAEEVVVHLLAQLQVLSYEHSGWCIKYVTRNKEGTRNMIQSSLYKKL